MLVFQSSVLAWAASCTPGEQGREEWKTDRMNIAPGFLRSEQSLCPFPQTSMQGRAVMQGSSAGLLSPRGPGPTAMAGDGSGWPGCWPKFTSDHFLHLRKRRMGLPGRKAGQGRWPGQVALVSRFPAAVLAAHPTEPCHPLPHATRHLGLMSLRCGC